MLQQEEEFERGIRISAPARTNGWHHGSRNQMHLQNAKTEQNSATCKAKAKRTYCRQEDAEEPSKMTSSCRTGLARCACCQAALNYQEELLQVPCTQVKSYFGSRAWQGRSSHDHHPAMHIGCLSSSSLLSLRQEHPLTQPSRMGDRRREASGTLQGGRRPSFGTTVPWPLAMSVILMVHVWFHMDEKQPAIQAKQTPRL